jgi:hypothetical protein
MAHFGTLKYGPADDPDGDGYSNMCEQIMGTNPTVVDPQFRLNLDLSVWNNQLSRLSWPSVTNTTYQVQAGASPAGPFNVITNISGGFPETEFFVPYSSPASGFFRLLTLPAGP